MSSVHDWKCGKCADNASVISGRRSSSSSSSSSTYSMITALGLPLLMVNGKFQNLSTMTVGDFETFIPFLVKCSVNKAGAHVTNGIPEWWSSIIQFKFPLQKPNNVSQRGYRRLLASLVCSCYWYHDAQYLLPFCANIANSPESVFLQSNEDNTTSVFYVHNARHVLKFNNENKNYDKKSRKEKPSRQSILHSLPQQETVIPDIYLCENCDAEFSSHSEMQKHEKECFKIVTEDIDKQEVSNLGNNRRHIDSPSDEIEILEYISPNVSESVSKNNFFNYIKLQPKSSDKSEGLSQKKKQDTRPKWNYWVNTSLSLYKNPNVEFSSFCGKKMLGFRAKHDLSVKASRTLLINEYYCSTHNSRTNKEPKELTDFRVTCRRPKRSAWSHQYCFNKQQRRDRYITLKTGLSEQSRRLLKQCKGVRVVLDRLIVPS